MLGVSPGVAQMLLASAGIQLVGISLLPLTRGLTQPLPTIGAGLAFLIGMGFVSRAAHVGARAVFDRYESGWDSHWL